MGGTICTRNSGAELKSFVGFDLSFRTQQMNGVFSGCVRACCSHVLLIQLSVQTWLR